jgi:hypothetical protein
MTGQVLQFPRRSEHEAPLSYRQLATALGVSVRFLKYRAKEGMPDAGVDYAGRRLFLLSEVTPWLDSRQVRLGRRLGDAHSPHPAREETTS